MTRSTHGDDPRSLVRSDAGVGLVADLRLRFDDVRLRGRVYWPRAAAAQPASPLILLCEVTEAPVGAGGADGLSRLLCFTATAVVLAVTGPRPAGSAPGHTYERAALGWAAEHAAELGASPQRLLVAGQHAGAARAAWLAIEARDSGWPQISRQVLVHPRFTAACPMPTPVAGVAPATVVRGCASDDDASRYAALLRASRIEVDELTQRASTLSTLL
jgi:hypothetical protein